MTSLDLICWFFTLASNGIPLVSDRAVFEVICLSDYQLFDKVR